jgi:hypothetical protein
MEINLLLKMEINLLLKVNLSLRPSTVFGSFYSAGSEWR